MSGIVYMVEGGRMPARYYIAVRCGVEEGVRMSAMYSRAVWCLGEEGLRIQARFCLQVGYGLYGMALGYE